MKNYNKKYIKLAVQLRKDMTPWENKLWNLFLKRYYPKFKRQQVIENYIVDFYCPSSKLIIELDGSGHFENQKPDLDVKRDQRLIELGFNVKRYLNSDIDENFYEVCQDIDLLVKVHKK